MIIEITKELFINTSDIIFLRKIKGTTNEWLLAFRTFKESFNGNDELIISLNNEEAKKLIEWLTRFSEPIVAHEGF